MQLSIAERFAAHLEFLTQDQSGTSIGVAVSGGGDSMALLYLANEWGAAQGVTLRAVTVDHGLRDGSADEAAMVSRVCGDLGVPHDICEWTGWDGQGNLQMAAREARREMIGEWAETHGIAHVLLGHTADDQAETVLMRLARGSGVDGLAGMRDGAMYLRPLLDAGRAELRAFLTKRGATWADDPSNEDARFDRIKARQMMGHLEALGLTRERLVQTARHMQMARVSLNGAMRDLAAEAVTQQAGDLIVEARVFADAGAEHCYRLIAAALGWVNGAAYRPRFEALERMMAAVRRGESVTLAGCLITPEGGDAVRISREPNAVAGLECASHEVWDNRWLLEGPEGAEGTIRALGEEGLQQCPEWREAGLPRQSLLASPAVWKGATLISAPIACMGQGWTATIATDFNEWLLSH